MILRNWIWAVYFSPDEGGGGDAGGGGDGGNPGGAGGDGARGAAGGSAGETSLRSQLAASLDEADRDPFNRWAGTYTSDKDFAKAAISMRSSFDGRVPLPNEKSKPEEIDGFWQKLGKPAEAKAYNFDWGKGEDGKPVTLDDDTAADFEAWKEHAHKNHYTQSQFEAGVKFFNDRQAQQEAALTSKINAGYESASKELKREWGADYEDNLIAAQDAGAQFSDNPDAWSSFVNLPLANGMRVGDHPTLLRAMAKIGRANGEDQRVRNMEKSGEAANINEQIAALEQEAFEKRMPTSQEPYYSKLQALYKKLHPKTHSSVSGTNQGFGV